MSRLALVVVLAACSHGAPPEPPPSEPLPLAPLSGFIQADSLVTVVADDWSSTKVRVQRWSRSWTPHPSSVDQGMYRGQLVWEAEDDEFDAVIGSGGLAWGAGLHGDGAPKGHAGPVKREGDQRSPAGAFRIGETFGFDVFAGRVLTDHSECVDDPNSASYNEIVERNGSADWTSSEHMRSIAGYALGAFVEHNPKRSPGAGSCIFLHIWDGPDSTTVGCTAMSREKLEPLLRGLGKNAVLVQLPKAEYLALQHEWGLPRL